MLAEFGSAKWLQKFTTTINKFNHLIIIENNFNGHWKRYKKCQKPIRSNFA